MGGYIPKFFYKANAPASIDNVEKSLLNCKLCRDNLKSLIKKSEKKVVKFNNLTKEYLKQKNRDQAKKALKQSKVFEEQKKGAIGKLNMLTDQINALESCNDMKRIMEVLQEGNNILKNYEKDFERFEEIKDDFNSLKENQSEMTDFFKQYNINHDEFEEEVNNELLGLCNEIDLPNVNNSVILTKSDKDMNTKEIKIENRGESKSVLLNN